MMQVLFEIYKDILEFGKVRGIGVNKGLVGLDHRIHLGLPPAGLRIFFLQGNGPAAARGAGIEGEKLVETEVAKQVAISFVQIDDVQMPLPEFAKPQGDAGHGSHERGIHRRTVAQIDDKFPVAAIDHLLCEFLDA